MCVFFWARRERTGGGIHVTEWGKVCDLNLTVNPLWLLYLATNHLTMTFSFPSICVWSVHFVLRERHITFAVPPSPLSYKWVLANCQLSLTNFWGGRGELIRIGLATHPWGGVAIHLVAPSHKDRKKPGPLSSSVRLTAKCKENYLQQTSRSVRSRC